METTKISWDAKPHETIWSEVGKMWNQDSQDTYPGSLQERPPPITSQGMLEFAYLFNFSTFITYV